MGEKQLDFNAPLLSVRRFASPLRSSALNSVRGSGKGGEDSGKRLGEVIPVVRPPVYRSDFVSGPVRDSGSVPFVWEKVPGRPKDSPVVGARPNSDGKSLERPPSAPGPPPGKVVHGRNERVNTMKDEDRKIETVARPNYNLVVQSVSSAIAEVQPRDGLSQYSGAPALERDDKANRNLEDDDGDAFSDSLDTVSVTELSLFNDSVSGESGPDGHELKRGGNSASGRRLMLERFLPAAKAMASEAPPHAPRKKPLACDPVKPVNRVPRDGDSSLSLPYEPIPFFIQQYSLEEEEGNINDDDDDDNDDEGDEDEGSSTPKACGIFPWSLKNSLCLTNPLILAPGVRAKKQNSFSHKGSMPVKSNDSGSFSGSDELTWEAVYKHKLVRSIVSPSVHASGSKLSESASSPSVYEDTANNHLNYLSDSQTQDGSLSYRRSTGGISPYRNEASSSPFREGSGFLGVPKSVKSFSSDGSDINMKGSDTQKGTPQCRSKGTSGSANPTTGKTAYVDSMSSVETSYPKSIQTGNRGLISASDVKLITWAEMLQKQGEPVRESHLVGNDIELNLGDEKQLDDLNLAKSVDAHSGLLTRHGLPSSADALNLNHRGHNTSIDDIHAIVNESMPSVPLLKPITGGTKGSDRNLSKQQVSGNGNSLAADSEGNSSLVPSLLQPPLPKSPSESWLFRALPAVPIQGSSSLSFLQHRSKKNAIKPSVDPKWEAIIKGTNVHPKHRRYSQELSQSVPHQTEK